MPIPVTEMGLTDDVSALYDRIARLERRPIASAGFDPNEDPVIIGSGATAGGGSTPSNPTGGAADAIVIGDTATAAHAYDIAIGYFANVDNEGIAIGENAAATGASYSVAVGVAALALDSSAVAIGHNAQAKLTGISIGENARTLDTVSGDQIAIGDSALCPSGAVAAIAIGSGAATHNDGDVAIGRNATASGSSFSGVAIGDGAQVSNDSATALGTGANASGFLSTAVGAASVANVANQIKLGASGNFVEVAPYDGTTYGSIVVVSSPNGTRYALQVSNAGAFSVIASPV